MTKLNWSKARSYDSDPARVREVIDFSEPDSTIVSVTQPRKLTAEEELAIMLKRLEDRIQEQIESRVAAKQAKADALAEEARKTELAAATAEEKADKKARREALREDRQRRLAAKLAAEEVLKQTPEYIARQAAEQARIDAEERDRSEKLRIEREPLRQHWRGQLLKRKPQQRGN